MIRKAVRVLLIPFVLFFSFQLLSIGLPVGIPVVVLIAVTVLLLTGKKEEVIKAVEAAGKWSQERAEIASVIAVQSGKVLAAGIQAGYQEMGGTEGAKKAVDELSKGAEEALKITGHAVVKGAEAVGNAVKAVGKQVEEDRKKKRQENQLEDTTKFVKFVVMDDD
jgi:hypothetical protein